MKGKRQRSVTGQEQRLPLLVVLGLCFFAGMILGQVLQSRVPAETGDELRRYLEGFVRLGETAAPSFWGMFTLYFRYPLLAFLGSFTPLGVLLLPLTAAAFGFFLSFSVCCFAASFGAAGVLLAMALTGLRCAVTLPCFFLVAVPAFAASVRLMLAVFGRGRRGREKTAWKRELLCLAAVALFLLAGLCVDRFLSPWLLSAALANIAF